MIAAVGPERVRRGYLSAAERRALAELLDELAAALLHRDRVPPPVRAAYDRAAQMLHTSRRPFR